MLHITQMAFTQIILGSRGLGSKAKVEFRDIPVKDMLFHASSLLFGVVSFLRREITS